MKEANIILSIFILALVATSVSAELAVTNVTNTEGTQTLFSVEGNKIIPRLDVGETVVFIDGEEITSSSELPAGTAISIKGSPGEHEVEVRTILHAEYLWKDFKILQNAEPAYLDYVSYKRDKNRLNFAIKGVDFIHPDQLHTTAKSTNEKFENFSVNLDEGTIYCYPFVTTGQALFFSCSGASYPHTLKITVDVGMREMHTILIEEEKTVPPPTPEPINEETVKQEEKQNAETKEETARPIDNIEVLDDIVMQDSTPQSTGVPVAVQVAIILGFIAVMIIMFVESHHRYENKLAGKHHPQKNLPMKTNQKQNLPVKAKVQSVKKKASTPKKRKK